MRSLPLQSETIRITSVAGEIRNISVSGLAKAQLIWLFRNFEILDFPVLSRKQQRLIAQMWHAGPRAGSATRDAFDDAPVELIGTIDGFLPQLHQVSVTVPSSTPRRARFVMSSGIFIPALVTTMGVLLLGVMIGLWPKHESTTQPRTAAAPALQNRRSAPPLPARASAELALAQIPAETKSSIAGQPAEAAETSGSPLPGAMAEGASMPNVKPITPPLAANPKTAGKPEVMIRVSVDGEGRAQEFHVLSGDQTKVAAALNAARHWSFQPCSSSDECEHLLKYTDYGDASVVKIID